MDQLRLQPNLEGIVSTLSALVATPAEPSHSSSLADKLTMLTDSVVKLRVAISASRYNRGDQSHRACRQQLSRSLRED